MTEIRIIRSNRKTVALQVNEKCEVIVRAPLRYPERKIRDFVNEHKDWIIEKLSEQKRRNESKPELTREQIKYLKAKAKEVLSVKIEYYSSVMGVVPNGFKVTSAQKRFGSCSGENSLCFSYMLMLYPDEAIDYVVVHELAHIRHHNHSRDFYSFIKSVMPDYKHREKILKNQQLCVDFVEN